MRHAEASWRPLSTAPSCHTPPGTAMLLYRQHCEYVFERLCARFECEKSENEAGCE